MSPAPRASRLAPALAVVLGLAVLPAGASAATFCVQAPGCVGTSESNLGDAVDAANAAAGSDRVEIGAVTTPAPTTAIAGPLEIAGAGRTRTTISAPASLGVGTTLFFGSGSGGSALHDVTLRFGGTGKRALALGDDIAIRDVAIEGTADLTAGTGILAFGGAATVDESAIDLPSGAAGNTGVSVNVGATLTAGDLAVAAAQGLGAGGTLTLRRGRVRASGYGIAAFSGAQVGAYSSLLRTDGTGLLAAVGSSDTTDATLLARNLTMLGAGAAGLAAAEATSQGGPTATVSVYDSIATGYALAVRCLDPIGGPGAGRVEEDFNRFDTAARAVACAQGAPVGPHSLTGGAPGFLDAPAGDYRLRWGSPLIDASTPGAPAGAESPTDLGGLPRYVDGDGAGGPRVDIGAFEYQRRPPVVDSAGATPSGGAGTATFTATASDPDADPVGLRWRFDDGAAAEGAAVGHRFATGGRHTATVTAWDPAGLAATRDVSIDLPLPRVPTRPARMTALTLSPATFGTVRRRGRRVRRRGRRVLRHTTVAWRLDLAARVAFTVDRAASGRGSRRACHAPTRSNRRARRCVRWIPVAGTLTAAGRRGANRLRFDGRIGGRALRAGRYRLHGVAGTAGGATGPAAVSFRIVR